MGFVAQDVEEAIRDTQMQDCDLYHDGGEDGYASLCYEELIAPLVQGWQEHEKKMAQMQEEIDALNKEIGRIGRVAKHPIPDGPHPKKLR